MKKFKNKNTNNVPVTSANYYQPLQTLVDVNDDADEQVVVQAKKKEIIPPITMLKCSTVELHEICNTLKIENFNVRKVSIGIKVFCQSKEDYDKLVTYSKGKLEFFEYESKNDKPFKAILLGMDKHDPQFIKSKLINKGLNVLDVKLVHKKSKANYEITLYVVYFKKQTITLRELKQNYCNIEYMRVKWEHQKTQKNKITQCYNCQMFGHGSSRCNVKTFCAICAGPHKTAGCTTQIIKCANCHGPHKSSSTDCPNRIKYLELRERLHAKSSRINKPANTFHNYDSQFPNNIRQNTSNTNNYWNTQNVNTAQIIQASGNNEELFSLEEIRELTMDLITKLRNCKSKSDQFTVITDLACKFLFK